MKISLNTPSILPPSSQAEDPKLKAVARQFEAVFINQMVSEMRKTISRSEFLPEGPGEKVYQAMLDSDYAEKMADSDQIGLSKMIYQQLLRNR